jgi:hypothetical protein
MEYIREGKHGARSTKQAIAIGLSKARRAGVKLGAPPKSAKATTRKSAASASRAVGAVVVGSRARGRARRCARSGESRAAPQAQARSPVRRVRPRVVADHARARRRPGRRRRRGRPPSVDGRAIAIASSPSRSVPHRREDP